MGYGSGAKGGKYSQGSSSWTRVWSSGPASSSATPVHEEVTNGSKRWQDVRASADPASSPGSWTPQLNSARHRLPTAAAEWNAPGTVANVWHAETVKPYNEPAGSSFGAKHQRTQGGKQSTNDQSKGAGKNVREAEDYNQFAEEPAARRKGQKGGNSKNHDSEESRRETATDEHPKRSGGSGAVSGSHLSTQRFSDLHVSAQTKRALAEGFGYEFMTMVQEATLGPMLSGRDVVARARTGTGKTLAFLVPLVETIRTLPAGNIHALILSPTRELAQQISDEAEVILRYHQPMGVLCIYGGTNIRTDHNHFKSKRCDVLVATPGRLKDHLENTPGVKQRLQHMSYLVLDEADQLLDMGFRDAIVRILKELPRPDARRAALFSATFPDAVGEIAKLALKADHSIINTVKADEEVTPDQIDQSVAVVDMEGMTELLWAALHSEIKRLPRQHKIMVFFTTARITGLYSELFCAAGLQVLEIHSRKSQAHRTKCADLFRKAESGIVFSSDVSARGLDYPDVTTVIQVGIPSSREQYIHRLGRTGRAGKTGKNIILLYTFEKFFLKNLKDLPVKQLEGISSFPGTPAAPASLWHPKDYKLAGQAYQAWMGYYNSVRGLGWSKEQLVNEAWNFANTIGAIGADGLAPPILKKTVGMMGLKGIPGLNIVSQLPYGD